MPHNLFVINIILFELGREMGGLLSCIIFLFRFLSLNWFLRLIHLDNETEKE